jgi:hypothetical protein
VSHSVLPAKRLATGKAAGGRHGSGKLSDAQLNAPAHIQESQQRAALIAGRIRGLRIPAHEGENTGLAKVVDMEEFAQWCATTPAGDADVGSLGRALGSLTEILHRRSLAATGCTC